MVLRSSLDLMILQKICDCIHLCDTNHLGVKILPTNPHAAINRTSQNVNLVKVIPRYGPGDSGDYKARPIPNLLKQKWQRLQTSSLSTEVGTSSHGERVQKES